MRIGISTYHSCLNDGAILQAYCLASALKERIRGAEVEIVDYRHPSERQVYGPPDDKRKKALSEFVDRVLPLSRERFEDEDPRKAHEYIAKNYDLLVVGSDEVWRLEYRRRWGGLWVDRGSPWTAPFPNIYWPDGDVGIRKATYGASVGGTDWRLIPRGDKRQMREILGGFSAIGFRDSRTRSFLRWLDPALEGRAEWVPDPTFALDWLSLVDRESVRRKLENCGVDFGRPRLGVVLSDSTWLERVVDQFRRKGFQIVGLAVPNCFSDVELFREDLTPPEWGAAFGFMDACLTRRMHPSIACILNGTPFAAVDFYGNALDEQSKLGDLMQTFGLLDYYYRYDKKSCSFEQLLQTCQRVTETPWPKEHVGDVTRSLQKRARDFIDALGSGLAR